MSFQIIRNDITKVKADVIVNTANPKPIVGGGTDAAIYKAAGEKKLLSERKKIGNISRGEVAVTPAFDLDAKYIIHTVGPAWKDGKSGEFEILENCYRNSLNKVLELKCRSVAFPLIATGVYDFPKDKALQVALSVIQPFVMEHNIKVILVVFDRKSFELSGNLIDNIREYVDANYVRKATGEEYGYYRNSAEAARYKRERELLELESEGFFLGEIDYEPKKPPKKKMYPEGGYSKDRINDLLASSDKTFQEKLFEYIDERGLTGPEVYKNYVSKQVYSKIQADKYYHPNKYTAIALCLSLHLDVDQTQDLIGRAGWTLSPSNKMDLVIKGCILNKEYNVVKINLILFDFDCPELKNIK